MRGHYHFWISRKWRGCMLWLVWLCCSTVVLHGFGGFLGLSSQVASGHGLLLWPWKSSSWCICQRLAGSQARLLGNGLSGLGGSSLVWPGQTMGWWRKGLHWSVCLYLTWWNVLIHSYFDPAEKLGRKFNPKNVDFYPVERLVEVVLTTMTLLNIRYDLKSKLILNMWKELWIINYPHHGW